MAGAAAICTAENTAKPDVASSGEWSTICSSARGMALTEDIGPTRIGTMVRRRAIAYSSSALQGFERLMEASDSAKRKTEQDRILSRITLHQLSPPWSS